MGVTALMSDHNQRMFPRIDLQCPISYRDQAQQSWQLSKLVDFSADSLLMLTNLPATKGQYLHVQLKPGKQKVLRGRGKVVRCEDQADGSFHVAIMDIHWEPAEISNGPEHHNDAHASEHRTFPRMHAQCPVCYRDSASGRWLIGRMIDFSATGLLMTTDKSLEENSQISLQVEPGSKKFIPALRGVGTVVRCKHIDDDHFEIAIKMLRIEPPSN